MILLRQRSSLARLIIHCVVLVMLAAPRARAIPNDSLPARQFNSTLTLIVFGVRSDDTMPGENDCLGVTPASKALSIPADKLWGVHYWAPHPRLADLQREMVAQKIPGLGLEVTRDADLSILKSLPNLHLLDLSGAPGGKAISDRGLENIKAMADLKLLSLKGLGLSDASLDNLRAMNGLTFLDLSWNRQLTDAGLKRLQGMTRLQALNLRNTQVGDSGLEIVQSMNSLHRLDLGRTRVGDAGLKNLAGLTGLRELELVDTQVGGAELGAIQNQVTLKYLGLAGTKVADPDLERLKALSSLEWLDLSGDTISDAGLQYLKGMLRLKTLMLNDTRITNTGLRGLAGLSSLRKVSVERTKVSDQAADNFETTMPDCELIR